MTKRRVNRRYPFKNAVCHAHIGGYAERWHRIQVERCIRRDGHPLPHRSLVYEWTNDTDHHHRASWEAAHQGNP